MPEPSIDDLIRPSDPEPRRDHASSTDFIKVMLGILIPLLVIMVGLVIAEFVIRSSVAAGVQSAVAASFHVEDSAVQVDLGPDLALAEAVNGQFATVTARVTGVTFGDASGDLRITATGVPTDRTQPVGTIDATLTVSAGSLSRLIADSTGFTPSSLTIANGLISTRTTLDLGIVGKFDAGVALRPGVGPGSVTLDPVTINLGTNDIPVTSVRELPVIGAFLAPALTAKEVCLADHLSAGLDVKRFLVVGSYAELTVGGTGIPLDASLARPGVCKQQ